ncbi:hypothetical protein DTO021D3_1053 [Paecilomyces variotii]|nr:hypothetical protein DTO032I3_918 [Paecilomyces variotii]KAJ9282301.1 hypothetical protein DTO021D3_1053 [Paecilomyces variotii]KAJ9343641.1 hypothetical protein DTO027B6_3859 [Paecilomyces variotii]KAJ9351032.1 hypothetical protein DTO027B9_6617 [Paecilomyces variotii]KAJ9383112.1 hypothetical protein DTO032I4_5379 [Paecilomyces variotii]
MPRKKITVASASGILQKATERTIAVDTVKEDTIAAALTKTFLGTVVLSVKCLNPPWKGSSNRDLDWKHVQTLRKDFTQGIHRFKPESRLKATTSETSFLKILKAYQQLSGKNMDIPTICNQDNIAGRLCYLLWKIRRRPP